MRKYVVRLHVFKNLTDDHDDYYIIETSLPEGEIFQKIVESIIESDLVEDIRYVKFEHGFVQIEPNYYAGVSVHRTGNNANERLTEMQVDPSWVIEAI